MRIKRQPFLATVQIGLWLHLAFAGIVVLPSILLQGPTFTLMAWSAVIDGIVGSVHGRYYLKTWPVQLFIGAAGGFFSNLIARAAAGAVIGMADFFSTASPLNTPVSAGLQSALSAAGTYVVMGAIFGAIGAAWTVIQNKGAIHPVQTAVLIVTVIGLWAAQYAYMRTASDLQADQTPAILNWIVAGLAVLLAFYIQNCTDSIHAGELGTMLALTAIGFLVSLAYESFTNLHGFPFGFALNDWHSSTVLANLLFWFNLSLLAVGLRHVFEIRSYSRE